MGQTSDQMELREEEITAHYPVALALLEGFEHAPRIAKAADIPTKARSAGLGTRRRFRSTTPGLVTRSTAAPNTVQLMNRVENAKAEDALISPLQATALNVLRRAISTSLAVAANYAESSGLGDLKRANLEGALPGSRKTEFQELLTGEALITLFVFASASAYSLAEYTDERSVNIGDIEELLTDNGQAALHGALWELDQKLAAHASDDERLMASIATYAEILMKKTSLRAQTAPRLEAFKTASWRVDLDSFIVDGFAPAHKTKSTELNMSFKKPNEVVGNHIAKHQALRLSKMLMAYDFDRKLNPFAELGGFIFTFMGDGAPGTGKTTLIQMMAGLVHEYCQNAGYTFRYQNFGIDNIDSYQGKSGQNAKAFIQNILDPNVIGFGTIDDIDQIAGKRGDRQSSAGQQEVTAVFMEAFAGANTIVRGNCTFGMFSNYPENVDDALRQRAGARFLVDGPQTRDDYIDILTLLMGDTHDIPIGDHDLFSAQEIRRAVAQSFEAHNQPKEQELIRIFERTSSEIGGFDTMAKLGIYLKEIQKSDDRFTGRAIKNITDAVKVRAMDFELPDDWMEEPERFLYKDYETKLKMISELRQPITVEMVVQEINRYADSEFRYADKSDEVAIENAVREMQRMKEAQKRYTELQNE